MLKDNSAPVWLEKDCKPPVAAEHCTASKIMPWLDLSPRIGGPNYYRLPKDALGDWGITTPPPLLPQEFPGWSAGSHVKGPKAP
mmetsp:Transcript_58153/g.136359  ORF Transcript_58153/g.136359 Transcript_58153/m.136359 type:complete len:84 (-) Transcript_58153:16-267(-)